MSFFDSKEEIIDIELTNYGKYLLSKGKFKPEFYAFFDDEIIYDSAYFGITESQNNTQTRILDETTYCKPQYNFVGAENRVNTTEILDFYSPDSLIKKENVFSTNKIFSSVLPLGKSSYDKEYLPAWSVQLINGNGLIDTYNQRLTGIVSGALSFIDIPQLNMSASNYEIKLSPESQISEKNFVPIGQTADGSTYAYYKEKYLLIGILENNVDDIKENFDIEVLVKEQISTTESEWKQLNFRKKPTYIKDNILLDNPEDNFLYTSPELQDPSYVEHFFEILVDDEIELPPDVRAKITIYDSEITIPVCPDPEDPCCPDLQKI
jgi:hypothetical protein